MGIVIKQSLQNSLYSYLGLAIGAINTLFLFPKAFAQNPEYFGLIQILLGYTLIISTFCSIGAPQIIVRYFQEVKTNERKNVTFFALILPIVLIFIMGIVGFIFRQKLAFMFTENTQDARLLYRYLPYLFPLVVFNIYFEIFSGLSQAHFKTVLPLFLKEVERRILTGIILAVYWMGWINIDGFVWLFTFSFLTQFVVILNSLYKGGYLEWGFSIRNIPLKSMLDYGFFTFLTFGGDLLISKIDQIMIGKYVNMESVGYYTIAFFIGSVINTPFKASNSIVKPVVAKYLSENDLNGLKDFNYKSALMLMLTSGLIFMNVSGNLNEIYHIVPAKFADGVAITLVISLVRFISSASGINGNIIHMGAYYRLNFTVTVAMMAATVLLNFWLLPSYGMLGAAYATGLVILISHIWKLIYVYNKYKIHPFTWSLIISAVVILLLTYLMFHIEINISPWIAIILKSLVATMVFVTAVYFSKISSESNAIVNRILKIH